jgi:hypothetical protein
MLSRLVKVLMLSAAIAVGAPIATFDAGAASAATQNAPVKLTAAQMLNRQRLAVSVMSKTYAALPKQARGKSTPFLKGLIDLANAYKEVDAASKARNSRKMGAALPKVATAIAKLNSAYQLSGIANPQLSASMKSLNLLWKDYLKVVKVTAPKKTSSKQMMVSSRKIDKMRHELMKRNISHKGDRRAAAQRAHMLALLKQADEANRRADEAWYASILMAEILGYYAGSYEYYTVYEPSYAVDYRQSWNVISVETSYFYSESVTYYEEYHWTSYEQTVDVSESYDFGLSQTEVTTVETQIEQTNVTVDQEAVTLYEAAEDRKALDTVETDIQVEESAADQTPGPDVVPASDTVAPTSPDIVSPVTPDTVAPGPDEAKPADENGAAPVNEACTGANPPADCPPAQPDGAKPDEQTQPVDGQPVDGQPVDGQPTDEVAPPTPDAVAPGTEDGQPTPDAVAPGTEDGQPTPDAVAPGTEDDQPSDQATPSDADNPDGVDDVCAGDNPPESCFAVEPDPSAPQDGDQPTDAQPDDQPQQDEAAPQDEPQMDAQPEEQPQEDVAPQQDEQPQEESAPADDGASDNGDVCASDNPPAECFPAQQEEQQQEAQPEEQPQEEVAPQEEPQMDVQPEEQPQEEAAPQQDESSDNGGDVCASDNPPAECFPQQEEAAPQEEEAAPVEEAPQEEAPAEEAPSDEAPVDEGG